MKYTEDYNRWEKAMLNLFDQLKQGKIKDNHFQVLYSGDNSLIDYMVTEYFIVSFSNLNECIKRNEYCYLKDIYIPKFYRNKGYGKLILEDLKKACKIVGIDSIETEPINKKSADFFIKNGFTDIKNIEYRRLKINLS